MLKDWSQHPIVMPLAWLFLTIAVLVLIFVVLYGLFRGLIHLWHSMLSFFKIFYHFLVSAIALFILFSLVQFVDESEQLGIVNYSRKIITEKFQDKSNDILETTSENNIFGQTTETLWQWWNDQEL